jgi:hypothetical protein
VNNEFERMQKEAVMVKFKVMSWYLSGATDEKHKKSSQQ